MIDAILTGWLPAQQAGSEGRSERRSAGCLRPAIPALPLHHGTHDGEPVAYSSSPLHQVWPKSAAASASGSIRMEGRTVERMSSRWPYG